MAGLRKRKKEAHKGEYGRVLVVGGSKELVGCVALCGISALKAGCDVVSIAAPSKVAWAVNCLGPDLITYKLDGDYFSTKHVKKLIELSKKADVILIGNGVGLKSGLFVKNYFKAIKKIDKKKEKYFVIDADALKFVELKDIYNSILTPHMKEFEIILKNNKINKNLINNITRLKQNKKIKDNIKFKKIGELIQKDKKLNGFLSNNNVFLIKGHVDLIINHSKIKLNKTGTPKMTVAGTGDILAGVCAGFLAQDKTKDLFKNACLAAEHVGKIGEELSRKTRFWILASEFLTKIRKKKK